MQKNDPNRYILVRDLIANARRRANLEKKYEDAIARLYSAIEKYAKIILLKEFKIDNSKAYPDDIPEKIRDDFIKKYGYQENNRTFLRFGLIASYELLSALEHHAGQTYAFHKQELENALRNRNNSILAHGVRPANEQDWNKLYDVAKKIIKPEDKEFYQFPIIEIE